MKQCPKCYADNPLDAKFCRKCGCDFHGRSSADDSNDVRPFHIRHPELNLLPASDSEFEKLFFWFNKPEYIENPYKADDSDYLYIVRRGKIGILYWITEKHWYGKQDIYRRIIPCKYDRIEKADGYFICHTCKYTYTKKADGHIIRHNKGTEIEYRDMKGNLLR